MLSVRLLHKFLGCPFARVQSAVMYQNQNLMMTKRNGELGKERKKEFVNVPKYRKFPQPRPQGFIKGKALGTRLKYPRILF